MELLCRCIKTLPELPSRALASTEGYIYDDEAASPTSQREYSRRRWGAPHRGPAEHGAVSSPGEKEEDRVYLKHSRRASWRTQSGSFLWTRPGHPPRAKRPGAELRLPDSRT